MVLNAGTNRAEALPAKISSQRFRAGDRLEITLVSGAGYGDPLKRDPAAVLADVLDGLLSAGQAESDYGVVLAEDGESVDFEATGRLRAARQSEA